MDLVTYEKSKVKCVDVKHFPLNQDFIDGMEKVMKTNNGIGLAASQVGCNECIFIGMINGNLLVVANPIIVAGSGAKIKYLNEGCLTIPGEMYIVKRWDKVQLEYQDKNGDKKFLFLKERDAQIVQHELDHLNGYCIKDVGIALESAKGE